SMTGSTVVTVVPVNDAPVLSSTSAGALAYTENSTVPVDSGLVVSDADSTQLFQATVAITLGFNSAEDSLSFVPSGGFSGAQFSYNATTGVAILGLGGVPNTLANYQAALRNIRYTNSSDSPDVTQRVISITVRDHGAGTAAQTSLTY